MFLLRGYCSYSFVFPSVSFVSQYRVTVCYVSGLQSVRGSVYTTRSVLVYLFILGFAISGCFTVFSTEQDPRKSPISDVVSFLCGLIDLVMSSKPLVSSIQSNLSLRTPL